MPAAGQFPVRPTGTEPFFIPPQKTQLPTPTETLPGSVEEPPAATAVPPTPSCYNNLQFMQDLSVLDGTVVQPGSQVDKRWQVQNSGTCNWTSQYTLNLVAGDPLGLESPQAMFPARSKTNAIIQLIFTAPAEPGEYFSTWQAADPGGMPFGEEIYLHIVVE